MNGKFCGLFIIMSVIVLTAVVCPVTAEETAKQEYKPSDNSAAASPLETAIFVRNNGGKELNDEIDTFNDMLSARLTDKGFAIMGWADIIQKFREANDSEENIYKCAQSFMASMTTTKTNDSLTLLSEKTKQTEPQNSMTEKVRDVGVTKSSALRIGQMLNAKYLIVASMGHIGHETRIFEGKDTMYKTGNVTDIFTLPLTVRLLDGTTGQSIYGDVLTASIRIYKTASSATLKDNVPDDLIDEGTKLLAERIYSKIDNIRNAALKASTTPVKFYINCNVQGATAEIDGAAIGSPPSYFYAKPGLHQLRITRQYFEPWEQTVNIFPDQNLNVSLEFTTEGQTKFKDLAAFKQAQELEKLKTVAAVDIAKQQSQADADVKEKLSSGGEVFLKNSYIRSDGFAEQLTQIIHGY